MSYTALYRKFRPDTFSAVKGQDHVITTLKNQIKAKRIGHAYLFCGTRGTGKTTVAKILARAINCEDPVDGDPCGVCPSCVSITAGSNTDVIEMDAASNNGVDDMRNIIDEVSYTPGMCKYRVYIVDEVHMLSTAAANAFLKTLEEPPAHAVFILATTDPQKLPSTILSRCQRYDFHRMSLETMVGHMEQLLSEEGVTAEDKALNYVARAADGSMRDALSLLDQCIAFHQGQTLTYSSVLDVLGAVDTEVFADMLKAVSENDVSGCIELVDKITGKGRELTQFVMDFTGYLRDILLERSKKGEGSDPYTNTLMYYIREMSELTERMRYASMKRVLLDTELIKLCVPAMSANDNENLIRRIAYLEKKVEELEKRPVVVVNESPAAAAGQVNEPQINAPAKANKPKPLPKAVPEDFAPLKGKWREIVSKIGAPASNYIAGGSLTVDESGGLLLVFADEMMMNLFRNGPEHEEAFKNIITDIINKSFDLNMMVSSSAATTKEDYPNLFDGIEMEVEIED